MDTVEQAAHRTNLLEQLRKIPQQKRDLETQLIKAGDELTQQLADDFTANECSHFEVAALRKAHLQIITEIGEIHRTADALNLAIQNLDQSIAEAS